MQAYQPIQAELIQVQQKIAEQYQDSDEQLALVLQELSARQGKMLRPAMVLLCGELFSEIRPEHIDFAAVIELIHIASLLHDDVIDNADLRRGQSSANVRWGNNAAVLLGDFLLSRAFLLSASTQTNGAAVTLGIAVQQMCTGELKQNLFRSRLDLTEQDYFRMIEAKTAALFQCSCQLGAMVSGASEEQQQMAGRFGLQFGMAFQIADDLRDIVSSEEQAGKTLGTDLLQEKFTLPVIHWINQDSSQRQARLGQITSLSDPAWLVEEMRHSGSIRYATEQLRLRIAQANEAFKTLPITPAKETLLSIADKVAVDIV